MLPGVESRVMVPQAIVFGFRSSQDLPRASHPSREEKKRCEGLWMEAIIEEIILLTRNYPVILGGMICLCRSVVNGLNKAVIMVLLSQPFSRANKSKSNFS
jgi:hypothetical protein